MDFEFATSQRIVFGPGKVRLLPKIAVATGTRPALLAGAGRTAPVLDLLHKAGLRPVEFIIAGEPTTERIAEIAAAARNARCDFVVAFGGGSALDSGKAVAALLANNSDLMDYLEVVGKGEPLAKDPLPCIAIPTTAGTGSEATRNAVLLSTEHRVKVSMRHPKMLPAVALVDPELTLSVPPATTATTGLDAFSQLLEAFVSSRANPLVDGLCREGIRAAARALPRAYANGSDLAAREAMSLASLFSGIALANAGLGAIHGFAGPIGGMFDVPHGAVCAALLPAVVKANIHALRQRAPASPSLAKYREAARVATESDAADADDLVRWLGDLCAKLHAPRLSDFGLEAGHFAEIADKAKQSSSMKGNPLPLTDDELLGILAAAF